METTTQEDGTDYIVVPAVSRFYQEKVNEDQRVQHAQTKIIAKIVEAEHQQPAVPHSVIEYVEPHSIRNCLLVACDGSHCRHTRRWGVGIVFLRTGNCLGLGGAYSSERLFVSHHINGSMIQPSFIELLALLFSLEASVEIGLRWRRNSIQQGLHGWDGMAGHLVVAVDTMSAFTNVLDLAVDGYFMQGAFDPLDDERGQQCPDVYICYAIVSTLSYAVAAFERVTILRRTKMPDLYFANSGMGQWQTRDWFPDQVANSARIGRDDRVDFREVSNHRWVQFAVKNKVVENNQLQMVTFAYAWWD